MSESSPELTPNPSPSGGESPQHIVQLVVYSDYL